MNEHIVAKFGGTSCADATQLQRVRKIILANPRRSLIVVSAPGKRYDGDDKVTDLFLCWNKALIEEDYETAALARKKIFGRFKEICNTLFNEVSSITKILEEVERKINLLKTAEFAASRGEYICAKIVAQYLGYRFVDAADIICFGTDGKYDKELTFKQCQALSTEPTVIPGFYGAMFDGTICTFSRGGSDITGAILAAGTEACLYENFTDVNGLLMADPRIVENPKQITRLSYRELRELAYSGASVFHSSAMFPVREAGISTNIRNTNEPENPGTLIVPENLRDGTPYTISGIAGRTGFSVLRVTKAGMGEEEGFARKLTWVIERNHISVEHIPGGIDSLSVVVNTAAIRERLASIVGEIANNCECGRADIQIKDGMALIAVVGRGMINHVGVLAQISGVLADTGINIKMVNQGTDEMNIIIGVATEDYEEAIRVIYKSFVN